MMTIVLALSLGSPGSSGIRWIDVGQGAALMARGPQGHTVLVDSGPSGAAEAVTAALMAHEAERIDLWIHTHLDADHIGGAARVRAGTDARLGTEDDPEVVEVWDPGAPWPSTDTVRMYRSTFHDERRTVQAGTTWSVDGMSIRVLEPPIGFAENENGRSLTLCLEVSGLKILVLGDAPESLGSSVAPQCPNVDALWASHHGSWDGISPQLVVDANPRMVVISAGRDNRHCHPSPRTLALLRTRWVWVLDGAGLEPAGPCPSLGTVWGPNHRLAAGDLWLGASLPAR